MQWSPEHTNLLMIRMVSYPPRQTPGQPYQRRNNNSPRYIRHILYRIPDNTYPANMTSLVCLPTMQRFPHFHQTPYNCLLVCHRNQQSPGCRYSNNHCMFRHLSLANQLLLSVFGHPHPNTIRYYILSRWYLHLTRHHRDPV